jgi:hypothetical protein
VAFTSKNQGRPREGRNRRDKGAIVGLSGWLFADLLLGVAVVFLIGSEKPSLSGNDVGARPTINIESVENVQEGLETWNVNDRSFMIKIIFSENVRSFEADDLVFEGPANGWISRIEESSQGEDASKSFTVEIVPTQELVAGDFELVIPEKSAFSVSNGIGNMRKKQKFTVVDCFEYKGIDVNRGEEKVSISGGYSNGTEYLTRELEKVLEKPIKDRDQIGFVILFGGGQDGKRRAEQSEAKVIDALVALGLIPKTSTNGENSGSCGDSLSENDFPILFYKDDGQPTSDLQLNIYYLKK